MRVLLGSKPLECLVQNKRALCNKIREKGKKSTAACILYVSEFFPSIVHLYVFICRGKIIDSAAADVDFAFWGHVCL